MKRIYTAPALFEYGALGQLTRGGGGTKPDYDVDPGPTFKRNDNDCTSNTTGCFNTGHGSP